MAVSTIKVVSSCKFLFIKSNAHSAGGTTGEVSIRNLQTGITASAVYTLTFNGAGNFGQTMVSIDDLPGTGGVYEFTFSENGGVVAKRLAIVKCDIDCCLVKLTNELIDCACDCDKYATSLAKAQKIFLLLKSAETATENYNVSAITNTGFAIDAMNKYKKAKEICDASCGCDC